MLMSATVNSVMNGLSTRASHVPSFAEVIHKGFLDEYSSFERKKIALTKNRSFKRRNKTRTK